MIASILDLPWLRLLTATAAVKCWYYNGVSCNNARVRDKCTEPIAYNTCTYNYPSDAAYYVTTTA
jgi:hypothetical protein